MSSLARARSLRKPAGSTALPPRERPGEAIQDPNRNVSPSRLPTKPPTASRLTRSATTTTTTTTTPARSASGRFNRPGSASSNASSAATSTVVPKRSVSLGKRTTTGTATQGGHTTTAPPARKDAQRYPPLSSATRPASMIVRPTSAGSTASASASTLARRTTPTHARANSAAMTATTPASTIARGAAHRPPTTTAPTQQERKSRSRPPSRDQASSSSSGAAAAAAAAAAAPGTPKRRAESADKQQPPTTSPAAAGRTPRLQHRPAFNSLQQRLSPAKTSSPRAAATPPRAASPSKLPANVAAAAETARLQGTLLQLHLLHRDAGATERQWHASAKAKLGTRFRALRDAHRALVDREAAAAEADNAAALRRWASGDTQPLDAKVRALDAALSGVWAMSEPGGKYARAVRRFERWVERVMDLEEARDSGTIGLWASGRSSGGGGGGEEALFIPELEPAWAVECAGMALKLEGWQDQLDGAASPHDDPDESDGPTTGLGRMLDGARSLVADMLAELTAMEEIRQAAVTREENWIESMNRDDDDDDESDAPPRAGAVWRAL